MAGLLNIGLTGLNTAQAKLNTASHNIANADTQGFSRQTVVQNTIDPIFTGAGFFGQGARVVAVTRQYSQFLENQVLSADTKLSQFSAYEQQIAQINALLADPLSGLSPAVDGFFAGVQEFSVNPSSIAARQALLSNAESLVGRFQSMDTRLSEIRHGVEGEIRATVTMINTYAERIAEINHGIARVQAGGVGLPANDLQDKRDSLVRELNQLVKTSSVIERDGSLSVFIGSGQNLVLGQSASRLEIMPPINEPTAAAIGLRTLGGNTIPLPDGVFSGGKLNGLLNFRRDALDAAQNQLGLLAAGLSEVFNAQHRLGVDLDGALGLDFFKPHQSINRPPGTIEVAIIPGAVGDLQPSDYRIDRTDSGWEVTRLSDNVRVIMSPNPSFQVDGLQFDINPARFDIGERAMVQPYRFAAQDINLGVRDVRKLAAGNPLLLSQPLSNTGTARVSDIRLIAATDSGGDRLTGVLGVPADLEISFIGTLPTLSLDISTSASPPTVVSILGDQQYLASSDSSGKRFELQVVHDSARYSFSFVLSGTPDASDVFQIAGTQKGVADNRNALLLGSLQTEKLFYSSAGEPSATLQSAYAGIVSLVGNKTREAQVGAQAQSSLLQQAMVSRETLSGVNLDEEAANLIRHQQAYQASGRVMAIAQRLFDELLSIAR